MAKRPPSFRSDPAARKWGGTTRHSTTQRGYGYAWQVLRAAALKRDKNLCQKCLRDGLTRLAVTELPDGRKVFTVDHIVPLAQGGTNDLGNLQSLCGECHHAKTVGEAAQGRGTMARARIRVSIGKDGWPT